MRSITVKGTGRISVKPDLIVVSMTLETKDSEYEKTMETAAEKIELLNKSLEEIGFEKESVKTTNFNVSTDYESVRDKNGGYKRVLKGYVSSHNLKVEFDFDTKKLAKTLSAISRCLATPEFSVSFTVKDPTALNGELLKSAARNAREKAEILCSASGARLGELTNIDYNQVDINVYSPTGYRLESSRMMKAEALPDIEIEPDDVTVNDSASFTWEIL